MFIGGVLNKFLLSLIGFLRIKNVRLHKHPCSGLCPSSLPLFPGGGSGIGRAVCQRLASEGASVVVADISEESTNETLESLASDLRGQVHMAAAVDVSSKDSVKKLVTKIQVWKQSWNRTRRLSSASPLTRPSLCRLATSSLPRCA